MTRTPTPSIVLSNGVEVRVGDVVPMTDGSKFNLVRITCGLPILLWLQTSEREFAYTLNGQHAGISVQPAIDLAALSASAVARPAGGVSEDAVRALVADFRARAAKADRLAGRMKSNVIIAKYAGEAFAYSAAAAALTALLGAKGDQDV